MKSSRDRLIICDMDGTLFDTSMSNYYAYRDACKELGYTVEEERFLKVFVGKNYKDFLPYFGVTSKEDLAAIHELKKAYYEKYMKCISPNEGLIGLLKDNRDKAVLAVATTASKKNTMELLSYFGLSDMLDIVLTQEDVGKLKPDPECYIKVMEEAQIVADRTVIFEDSASGIKAAIRSGAKYVRVNNYLPMDIKLNKNSLCLLGCKNDKNEEYDPHQVRFIDYLYYIYFDNGLEILSSSDCEKDNKLAEYIRDRYSLKTFTEEMFLSREVNESDYYKWGI